MANDRELLIQQDDEDMDTECKQFENGDYCSCECAKCSDDSNDLFTVLRQILVLSTGCSTDSSVLRQKVADILASLYRYFLCQPVFSEDGSYTADTAQPTADDEYINSVSDPQLQTEHRWQKYVRCEHWVTI